MTPTAGAVLSVPKQRLNKNAIFVMIVAFLQPLTNSNVDTLRCPMFLKQRDNLLTNGLKNSFDRTYNK